MRLVDTHDRLMVHVRWRSLFESEDTFEPPKRIYEDVPKFLLKLSRSKNFLMNLVARVR